MKKLEENVPVKDQISASILVTKDGSLFQLHISICCVFFFDLRDNIITNHNDIEMILSLMSNILCLTMSIYIFCGDNGLVACRKLKSTVSKLEFLSPAKSNNQVTDIDQQLFHITTDILRLYGPKGHGNLTYIYFSHISI